MASLTKNSRTILKSRLRRHNDALMIAQTLEGKHGKKLADAGVDALLDMAQQFGVPVPGVLELRAYEAETGSKLALIAADTVARTMFPTEMAKIKELDAVSVAFAVMGTDADDANDTDDAPEAEATPAPVAAPEAPKADDNRAVIDAEVKAIMATMGAGDFEGYQAKLRDVVARAHKPAEVVQIHAVDTSKLSGHVATVIGHKTAPEVGIKGVSGIRLEATKLPVYNSPTAPAIDQHYNWHPQTGIMLSVWRRGQPVFGYGPAGTGKTSFAQQLAARWGRDFVRISCDDQTEAQTLVGMTVPSKDGGVVWQDGQLTAAIRRPGTVVLIDEPSVARPGALFVLQSVMDADKKIHIAETGEVVHVAPDVLIMLADNTNGTGDVSGQYEATRRLNRATLDRPDVVIRFDYLSPAEEAQILVAKSGCSRKVASILSRFGALTRTKADEGKLSHPVGMRNLLSMGALLNDGAEPTAAFQTAIVERVPFDDREPLRQFWTAGVNAAELEKAITS